MSPHAKTNPGLDELIDEITVDCHDEDEQLMAFHAAFDDEARLPAKGTVIGEDVEVLSINTANNRRELIATCQRDGRRYEIALLDTSTSTQTRSPHASSPHTAAGPATEPKPPEQLRYPFTESCQD